MPHPLDGPQVDNRPPLYACGPSFGMLGPSRLFVAIPPTLWPEPLQPNQFIVPYAGVQTTPFPWQGRWLGSYPNNTLLIALTNSHAANGTWQLLVHSLGKADTRYDWLGTLDTFNFTWQFPSIFVDNDFGGDTAQVGRIAEWHTVSERTPLAIFPDE